MPAQKPATLATIFSDVLADLAFMFTEEDAADAREGEPWLETTIEYRGPFCGALVFRCPEGFTRLLAANLLGIDPDLVDMPGQNEDAVKEFMNIVCGQFVTAVHGTDAVFNLTIPRTEALPQPPDLALDDGVRLATLCVENYRLQLAFQPDP